MELDEKLLREFVETVLSERLRNKFDMQHLKQLKTPRDVYRYASAMLDEAGVGSSRATFILSSGKVLKVAYGKEAAGCAQNAEEIKISADPSVADIVAKVFSSGPNNIWIISELVRPLEASANQDFKQAFGADFDSVMFIVEDAVRNKKALSNWPAFIKSYAPALDSAGFTAEEIAALTTPKVQALVQEMSNLVHKHSIEMSDLIRSHHWGKTSNGKLVLLDYGASNEVLNTHYNQSVGPEGATAMAAESVIVNERIRKQGKFDLNAFKKLKEPFMMSAYCFEVLQPLGEGSSREAWVLNSSKVLKIARPSAEERGRAQNEAEFKVYQDPMTHDMITKIFDHDPNFNWLISEIVRPLSESEFKGLFGLKILTFHSFIVDAMNKGITFDEFLAPRKNISKFFTPLAREWAQKVIDVAGANKIEVGDITRADHWGKTAEGRIVLLDYGLTTSVWDEHWVDNA